MENLIFRYCKKEPMGLLVSNELMKKIEHLQFSRIDGMPIYKIDDSLLFDKEILNILNYRDKGCLRSLLRKDKINKLFGNDKEFSLELEFLSFWYSNFDDLYLLMPLETSTQSSPLIAKYIRAAKLRKIYNKIYLPNLKYRTFTI